MAWVGDGNNMANTWLQAAKILGFTVHVSTPSGYGIDSNIAGVELGEHVKFFKDPHEACKGADLVTTDVSKGHARMAGKFEFIYADLRYFGRIFIHT